MLENLGDGRYRFCRIYEVYKDEEENYYISCLCPNGSKVVDQISIGAYMTIVKSWIAADNN